MLYKYALAQALKQQQQKKTGTLFSVFEVGMAQGSPHREEYVRRWKRL